MADNDVPDKDYVSRTGQKETIPVQDDNAPVDEIDEVEADTDKALGTSHGSETEVALLLTFL